MAIDFLKWVVYICHRIKMESKAIFKAILRPKFVIQSLDPDQSVGVSNLV